MRPLVIPFRADTEPASRAIATLARAVATGMGSVSASALAAHQATGSSLGGIALTAARAAASLTAFHYVALGAFAAFTAAAAAGAAELGRFEQIAKRAADANVGTTFFQAFSVGAHQFRLEVKALEEDLSRLERSTRDRFDGERAGGVSNRARDLLQERFRGTNDFGISAAPALLDAATSAEERIQAVLVGLRDMEAAGQRLAAIDLARQLGLTALAEQVDRGTASFAGFLAEVEKTAASGVRDGSLVSPELIARAEELKRRWEANTRELQQNLRPILDECARLALAIGNGAAWTAEQFTRVVGVVGRAVGLMRELASLVPATMAGAVAATEERTITGLQTRLRDAGLTPLQRRGLEEQLRTAEASRARREASQVPEVPILEPPSVRAASAGVSFDAPVPLRDPRSEAERNGRQTGTAGGASADETDKRTEAVEKFIRTQERAIALSQVELATVGRSAVERARLTEVVKAEAQAREQGGRLTEAERDKVAALAAQQQILKNAIEDATAAQRALSDALKYGGDRLIDLVFRGGKASDMLRGLAAELARAALTGQGIFAQLMGLAPAAGSPAGSLGGLLGLFSGLFGGGGGGGAGAPLNLLAFMQHAGGEAGSGVPMIAPAALFAGAPRAHSGRRLGADEVPIIAQLGEEVLTRSQRRATARALDMADRAGEATTGRAAGNAVSIGDIRVDAPGASRADAEEIARRVDQRIREVTVPFLQGENARGVEIDPYTRGLS
ncbi:hypothetical protein [Phreatobacter sp.]|uniref:hypothetical protein n=1 Tax=Phreatobacter sp. TaxID=1966341 RepID=UPI003F6EDD31